MAAAPILVPCLVALRREFNLLGPRRDKGSDGWLGDRAHALNSSDHNGDESGRTPYEDADNVDEVHGLDVDDTGPWINGFVFDVGVELIRLNHHRGRDDRLQNIIRNGRIASRSWGWDWRDYNGPNGHYEHAHFSARYTTAQERDTSPWGLEERWGTDVAFADDKIKITETTGRELYEPDLKPGTEVYASSVLQLAAIHARRAALSTDSVETRLTTMERDIAAIKAAVVPPPT
ncbi:hypothetical protein ACIBSW_13205 [Actinoplanes sp. NPDC049668]|uniref:hypothetical protein n=1 Tax=unclassified Actinoplanes TaxID=2626549 RepID=UPI0033B5F61D